MTKKLQDIENTIRNIVINVTKINLIELTDICRKSILNLEITKLSDKIYSKLCYSYIHENEPNLLIDLKIFFLI